MMLPSTGHFKAISCPFYDSGLCERPYCHFRHVKKDVSSSVETNGAILQHLVSEAVKKVLQQKEVPSPTLVSKVVEELTPAIETPPSESSTSKTFQPPAAVPSYRPTPIAELKKKRHIPVPYTPRNCSTVQAKRRKSSDTSPLPKRVKPLSPHKPSFLSSSSEYVPEVDLEKCVGYSPTPMKVTDEYVKPKTYLSSTLEYNPDIDMTKCVGYSPSPASNADTTNKSYIPSSIATLVAPTSDYVPAGSKEVFATYEPSKSKKRESEYKPQGDGGAPLTSYIPTDKSMLEELNMDDFSTEFALLDEIISEHTSNTLSREKGSAENVCSDVGSKDIDDQPSDKVDCNHANGKVPKEMNNTNGDIVKKNSDKIKKSEKGSRSEKDRHHRSKSKHRSSSSSHHKSSSKSSTSVEHSEKDKEKSSSKSRHTSKHKSSKSSSSSKTTGNGESTSTSDSLKPSSDIVKSGSSHSKSSSRSSKHKSSSSSSSHPKKKSKSSRSDKSRSSSSRDHSKGKPSKHEEEASDIINVSTSDQDIGNNSDGGEAVDSFDAEMMESESDEDKITEECLRIFQEYSPNPVSAVSNITKKFENKFLNNEADNPKPSSSKQRVAHEGAQYMLPKMTAKRSVINPGQVMARRIESIKESYLQKKAADREEYLQKLQSVKSSGLLDNDGSEPFSHVEEKRLELPTTIGRRRESLVPATQPALPGAKLRIAHVPNVNSLLEATSQIKQKLERNKGKVQNVMNGRLLKGVQHSSIAQRVTIAQTVSSGGQRVAHVPVLDPANRPGLVMEPCMKIPYSARIKTLYRLEEEFLKTISNPEAYLKAHALETICCRGAKSRNVYTSAIVNCVMQSRKERGESSSISNSNVTMSHADVLSGKYKHDVTVVPRAPQTEQGLYDALMKHMLSEKQLIDNGFPLPDPDRPGSAIANSSYFKPKLKLSNFDRICDRCKGSFNVTKTGFQLPNQKPCMYHPRRIWRDSYPCCAGHTNSPGCAEMDIHVSSEFSLNNWGFVSTLPPEESEDEYKFGVFALDCEMVFTTRGMELARVTVVNHECKTVYDTLVKPSNPVIDYATEFSGIKKEDLENISTNIRHVQAILLSMFKDKTILIGHSLDSDMRALKIMHRTVVDTSVMYPHNHPGRKKGLKTLAAEHLHKSIQEAVGGHDSTEDAVAAMQLALKKVNFQWASL